LYTHFGSDNPDIILDKMRFLMSAADCKFLFLDHISMVVSGLMADDERKLLDKLSTDIAMMAHDLDTCVIMVSHVNDDNKTRGSRNISKVADLHLHLSRDLENPDPGVRNTTDIFVKKNRFGSQTGPGGKLYFDAASFMLTEITDVPPATLPPVE
jgi:twinkle protein